MGLPLLSVSSSASSSIFFSTASAMRHRILPRSLADILRHGPAESSNALRAAATAWSTSFSPASETDEKEVDQAVAAARKALEDSAGQRQLPGLPLFRRHPRLWSTLRRWQGSRYQKVCRNLPPTARQSAACRGRFLL